MPLVLARNWWALALRGVAAILFGVIAILFPATTLEALVLLFAFYAAADGVFAIVAGVRAAERHERWLALVVEGVLGVVVAALLILWPGLTLLVAIYVVAFWALLTGASLLMTAAQLRRLHGDGLLVLGGVLSLVLGIVLMVWPIAGLIAFAWWIGAYAVAFGALLLVLSFRLRRFLSSDRHRLSRAAGSL